MSHTRRCKHYILIDQDHHTVSACNHIIIIAMNAHLVTCDGYATSKHNYK